MKDLQADVRVIAATNRNLVAAVQNGNFRQDLYYRLKVFPITLPPLRGRISDLPLLIAFFLEELRKEFTKKVRGLSLEAGQLLTHYSWPGNIRELRNVLERAFILCDSETIEVEHLPPELLFPPAPQAEEDFRFKLPPGGIALASVERDFIRQALEISGGNQVRAAKLLGISRDALRYRMKKLSSF